MTDTTTYNGGFIYRGEPGNTALDYVLTPEGMIKFPAGAEYNYYLKDHLGNTRATITDADKDGILDFNSSEVLQMADYYPFGMQHDGLQGGANKYLYNGKELQDEEIGGVRLDWYYYGARYYDPAIGRFTTQDPLASDFPSWTSYHYVHNNPLILVDPTGMSADWFENERTCEIMNVKGESSLPPANEAQGWVNIGEDDMFGEENVPDGEDGTVTKLEKEESEEFMNENGYDLKPKEADLEVTETVGNWNEDISKQYFSIEKNYKIEKVYTYTYARKGAKREYKPLGIQNRANAHEYDEKTGSTNHKSWERFMIEYKGGIKKKVKR